ncbi:MAG: deoxyuridine 5'-triphosphate nucleotidohydrolase [Lachnospiraceae bacterium]|nr:deoxyuridine 5'-triphosphate nucleotidohydrolase [Lachnospiraceae bacterium]
MVELKIRYISKEIEKLRYIDGVSDWIDLRSAENVSLKAGESRLIRLGIAVELPEGYEAHIVPRSSTYKNFGILQTNHFGVVDHSYCDDEDEWKYPVLAMRDTEIHVNDRICQFRIMKNQPKLVFTEVEHLTGASRGGFGTTGVK